MLDSLLNIGLTKNMLHVSHGYELHSAETLTTDNPSKSVIKTAMFQVLD